MGDSQHVSEQSLAASLSGVETTPLALDLLYNEVDKLYHAYARGCGLSDIERAGGELPLARLTESWSYSKQTINSALKVLQERGLIALTFMEGSRKSKLAAFTEEGRAFSAERIVPAIRAEERAFSSLTEQERSLLVQLVRRYIDALEQQILACAPEACVPT